MTVKDLIIQLQLVKNQDRNVIISNLRAYPFSTTNIREVLIYEEVGPVFIRIQRSDSD